MQIESAVTEILADRLDQSPRRIKPASRLVEDLGADSLDLVEIVMQVEEAFDIAIEDEAAERIRTVADLLAQVSALVSADPRGVALI